jgi:ribosomal protein S4
MTTENDKKEKRAELVKKLRSKIGEKSIKRSSKISKENILDKTLGEMGIDKTRFMKDLEAVNKNGSNLTFKI